MMIIIYTYIRATQCIGCTNCEQPELAGAHPINLTDATPPLVGEEKRPQGRRPSIVFFKAVIRPVLEYACPVWNPGLTYQGAM